MTRLIGKVNLLQFNIDFSLLVFYSKFAQPQHNGYFFHKNTRLSTYQLAHLIADICALNRLIELV